MRSLSMRVLGDFSVDGVEATALGSRKGRALLRLLALARGQPVSVDILATALWGDTTPARPAEQISVLVSRLRTVLGRDRLEHSDAGYRVHYDWLDADELGELTAEIERRQLDGNLVGAVAAARVALSMVRGELAPEEDPWAQARLAELDRLVARARRLAAAALTSTGSWLEAVDLASSALERDPYDEDSLRLLMRAYVVGGRVGSALSAYEAARRRLADDLGVDPSQDSDALHVAILRGEPVVTVVATRASSPTLVGRQLEWEALNSVAARSRAGSAELVVIEGEAGIGKTSLIRAWTEHRAAQGDAVLSAACGPLDRAVPLDGLLTAIGAHLRTAGPDRTGEVLGADRALLEPIFDPVNAAATPAGLADGAVGQVVLFAAVVRILQRLSTFAPLVLVLDDAHLGGPVLEQWLEFVTRRAAGLMVLVGLRSGLGAPAPFGERMLLGPLDRASTAVLVGEDRADELLKISGGNPLFLSELAATSGPAELPSSLVDAVLASCRDLGAACADLLRTAAVIGPQLDLELLSAILHRPVIDVLGEAEEALGRRLLIDDGGAFWFRHELVRNALASGATAARRALIHREASRVLSSRPDADPVQVAEHARRGGDVVNAAHFLRVAARRASQHFDHVTAESLLDDALQLREDVDGWLDRARTRTLRGRYALAIDDVQRASDAGAAALEVGAWASYFDRRFEQAIRYAQDGQLAADDSDVRARCLTVGGRTHHAAGDLGTAEQLLGDALLLATGTDRVTASAWLGVLRAHQSRFDEALRLLSPATRGQIAAEHSSATLHSLLFSGHAHACAGRPDAALKCFAQFDREVERRHLPRFAGRGVNFSGWVLRSLGSVQEGVDRHLEALDIAARLGTDEVTIAALEDLAEERLAAGDLDAAAGHLRTAEASFQGDLVFGWRLDMKLRLLKSRLALAQGDAATSEAIANALAAQADAVGVPRYASVARLLGHQARRVLNMPVDLAAVETDLDLVDRTVAIESWWWTGETAAALRVPRWVDRAAQSAAGLVAAAGPRGAALQAEARRRMDGWQSSAG